MKIKLSQKGHAHFLLIALLVISLVSAVGFSVYKSGSNKLSIGTASLSVMPKTCDDIDNLSDDEYDQLPDSVEDQLCGPIDDTDPTKDPGTSVDPCADLPMDVLEAMSDEEYTAKCLGGDAGTTSQPSDDEQTDGGKAPVESTDIKVTTSNGSKKVSIKLTNLNSCISTASQLPVSKIKTFGNTKINNRKAVLKSESSKIDKNYSKTKISTNLKARKVKVNVQIKKVAKKYHKRYASIGGVSLKSPTNHKKDLKVLIKAQNSYLNSSKQQLKSSKTSAKAAQAMCNGVVGSQVLAYVVPKIKAQKAIDNLYVQNTAYSLNYQAAKKVNKITRKAVPNIANPNSIKSQIDNLQSSLNGLDKATAANYVSSGGKPSQLFSNRINGNVTSIQNSIRSNSTAATRYTKSAL